MRMDPRRLGKIPASRWGRDIEITLSHRGFPGTMTSGQGRRLLLYQGTVTSGKAPGPADRQFFDRTDPNDTGFLVTAENVIRERPPR